MKEFRLNKITEKLKPDITTELQKPLFNSKSSKFEVVQLKFKIHDF